MVDEGRPLTQRERAVLERLLAADFPEADVFRAQAKGATVVSGAPPPSIELRVDRHAGPRAHFSRGTEIHTALPVAARGPHNTELLLFATDGWLDYLELVVYDPDQSWAELPQPDQLKITTRF